MITRIDHIGIAVQNIQDALGFFQGALGIKLDHIATEEGGRTKVAFMPVGTSDVELVEPQDTDSGLAKFLTKRGEGVHHICFEVDDIDTALARLKEHGAQLIDETPRENAQGMRYAFVHPKSAHGVLIELYQKPTKDGGRTTAECFCPPSSVIGHMKEGTTMFDKTALDAIKQSKDRWEETTLHQTLARSPERREKFITTSSEEIDRLYTPLDIEQMDYNRDLGMPGEYPYTRGVHATMHRGKLWTMRMFAGFGTAEETNARFKYLLEHGETGLSTAFDMPTLYGYDTDAPQALGEFGKCGVAISSLADMEILFDGIPVDQVTTSMTINSPAAIIWAMYIAAAEKRGIPRAKLGGTIQNDILKEYIAQKEFIFPPEPSMRLVVDTMEFGTREMPLWNTVSISGYHIREAGSTAAQELAFTLADGMEYVRWGIQRGMNVDDFAPRLSFFFNAHNDFFEEIAKYRAARRIWAKWMREKAGAQNPRSWLMRFHTQTAGVSLTAQQPMNNVARVAIQALAAVLGGTQSLHTNSLDEAWAVPSESAATIALRTQQIIANESGVTNTIDPLGGSYFIEALTNRMEQEANAYFDKVTKLGGVLPALRKGFFQREIAESAARYQTEIEKKERIIVGVNDYVVQEELKVPLLRMDEAGARRQCERLQRVRRERDGAKVQATLNAIRDTAKKDRANLMPPFIDAVNAYATLGEIMDMLRKVWGEYKEPVIV